MRHFIGGFAGGDALLILLTFAGGLWRNKSASVNGAALLLFGLICGLAAWGLWP